MEHFDPKMESLLKGNRAILKYTKEKWVKAKPS